MVLDEINAEIRASRDERQRVGDISMMEGLCAKVFSETMLGLDFFLR